MVEICADVVEREREMTSPTKAYATLILKTQKGAEVRIDGEESELFDKSITGASSTPIQIEQGSFYCPLLHLDDRETLAKKAFRSSFLCGGGGKGVKEKL